MPKAKAKTKNSLQKGQASALPPFLVNDCALISIHTGVSVVTLREFREHLMKIDERSFHHHFWGRLLQPQFDEPEYNNDFASWVFRALDDKTLAEKLGAVDPTEFDTVDELREELAEIVEMHMAEEEHTLWAVADREFHFIRSQLIVFGTGQKINQPEELAETIPNLSRGSIYYHFIQARQRQHQKRNDFSAWVSDFGEAYADFAEELRTIDPTFSPLNELQEEIHQVCQKYQAKKGRKS